MLSTRFLASAALLLVVGCAGGGQPSPEAQPASASTSAAASRFNSEVITQAELDQSKLGDVDALTVIKQLRPHFMKFRGLASTSDLRGGGIQVSVNNGRLSGTEILTSIRMGEIGEVRYLDTAAAAQRYGSLAKAGPVILLRLR